MNDDGMSDIREQLIGICVLVMLTIFVMGGLSIYAMLFWSKDWALASLCLMLLMVSVIVHRGYDYGRKLVYGFQPSYQDRLLRFFSICLIASVIISFATFVIHAEIYRPERWGPQKNHTSQMMVNAWG